jgi:hypothetical protein
MAKAKKQPRAAAAERVYSDDEVPNVPLDDESENWMAEHRLNQLRAAGWKGTVGEYMVAFDKLGRDPLAENPPITGG